LVAVALWTTAHAEPWRPWTLYVDCSAPPGGDGTRRSPFESITAALPQAEFLSPRYVVTIRVAAGVCNRESLPIRLGFPVRLQGERIPERDAEGFPLPVQASDTLIVRNPSAAVPPEFLVITGEDVHVSRLSIDGGLVLPDNVNVPPQTRPYGVLAQGATGFTLTDLRIVNVGIGVRSERASGLVVGNYVGPTNVGIAFFGGDALEPAVAVAWNNRVLYRVNGLVAAGGIEANPTTGTPAGVAIVARFWRNDVTTTYTDTGPANPAALRLSPTLGGGATVGSMQASLLLNRLGGTPKYAFILHGGPQVRRDADEPYTGQVDVQVYGTRMTAAAGSKSLITFASAQATELPNELHTTWDYLEGAAYDVRHSGELDAALVDHPEIDPVDGNLLGNQLRVNGDVVDFQTFVVIP
jgi:hypothetical protein